MKLKDYAASQPTRSIDKVKALPRALRREVDEGLDAGYTISAICRWLKTKGHTISETALRGYRDRRKAR